LLKLNVFGVEISISAVEVDTPDLMRISDIELAVAGVAIFSSFLCLTSAKIKVNIDDLDPLKDCKRRDVQCEAASYITPPIPSSNIPVVIESDSKVYMYGEFPGKIQDMV
jgi:hypothetical protein